MEEFEDRVVPAKRPRKRRHHEEPAPDDGADRGDGRTRFGTFADHQSGNPKGRPKGSLNASKIAQRVLFEPTTVATKDGTKTMSQLEAMIRQRALLGLSKQNVRALDKSIELGFALEAKEAGQAPSVPLSAADAKVLELVSKRLAER
ncbi:MAG: hypothetical protein JOZ74_07175, partial [Bradyrhizobium sp.]|nr:hypothetical protein [Bradyrhizobium sp.]